MGTGHAGGRDRYPASERTDLTASDHASRDPLLTPNVGGRQVGKPNDKTTGNEAIVPEVMHENTPVLYHTDDLARVTTFEEAVALAAQVSGGEVLAADTELGDGFAVLESKDKRTLIGVPLMFMEWQFNQGDMGEFVSARVAAKQGNGVGKYIINDGSTGIYRQLQEFSKRTGRSTGLYARHGLRVSDYKYTDNEGKEKPASTFYIDTSA
jgi:hypothetical protein